MRYIVVILSEAELDIDNAYLWYELQQRGLGNKFYDYRILYLRNLRRLVIPGLTRNL